MLRFGGLVGFSMIGIEWSKLQWLVAALRRRWAWFWPAKFSLTLSPRPQLFLFEKPIRIGDTVTIRDLTGSVTKSIPRATTIGDWDRKEDYRTE